MRICPALLIAAITLCAGCSSTPPLREAPAEPKSTYAIQNRIQPANRFGAPDWPQARKQWLTVGIMSRGGGGYRALVKGAKEIAMIEEGDIISVDYQGLTYRWKVLSITNEGLGTDEGIKTERLDVHPLTKPSAESTDTSE